MLTVWFMIVLMCWCGLGLDHRYEYWGTGKPYLADDDMGPDEVGTREDGA